MVSTAIRSRSARQRRRARDLVRDVFDAPAIRTDLWTTTDTEHRLDQAEEAISVPQDPSFERAAVGGIAGGWTYEHSNADLDADVTYSVDTDTPRGIGVSQKIVIAAVVAATRTAILCVQAAERYAAVPGEVWSALVSLKITAVSGVTVVARIVPRDAAGTRLATSSSASFTTVTTGRFGWVQTAIVGYTLPATTAWVEMDVYISSIDNGDSLTLYVDDVLHVRKAYLPGPHFDGDTPGCAWAGAAHASTSLRPDTYTNLLTANQSDVETDTAGFTALAGAAIAQSAVQAWHGANSLEIITPNVGAGEGAEADNTVVTPSTVHTAYAYLYGAGGGTVRVGLEERTAADALVGETQSAVITLGAYWRRVAVYRAFGATGARARVKVYTSAAQALTFYADGWLLATKGYAPEWLLGGTSSPGPATPAQALIVRGGRATSVWQDPGILSVMSIPRRAGRTFRWRWFQSTTGNYIQWGLTGTAALVAGANYQGGHGITASATTTSHRIVVNSTLYQDPVALSIGERWYEIILLDMGAIYRISYDRGLTWKVAWVDLTRTTSPLWLMAESFSDKGYMLPSTQVYDRTPPMPALSDPTAGAITPTLGGELLADTSLEANYTAGLCDTLGMAVGAPTVAESADFHTGAKAQSFLATANNDSLDDAVAVPATIAGDFYLATTWAKRTAGAAGTAKLACYDGTTLQTGPAFTDVAYAQKVMTIRAADVNGFPYAIRQTAVAPFDTILIDDRSWQHIEWSTMFGPSWLVTAGNAHAKITLDTDPGFTHAGLAWYVDDNNWLAVYHRGGSGYVLQRSAGAYTQLATVVKAWAASQQIEVTLNGTALTAYIGGTQIGGTLTVPAAIATATVVRRFSTWSGNQMSSFQVWGVST